MFGPLGGIPGARPVSALPLNAQASIGAMVGGAQVGGSRGAL
jgi:hypothetical protein